MAAPPAPAPSRTNRPQAKGAGENLRAEGSRLAVRAPAVGSVVARLCSGGVRSSCRPVPCGAACSSVRSLAPPVPCRHSPRPPPVLACAPTAPPCRPPLRPAPPPSSVFPCPFRFHPPFVRLMGRGRAGRPFFCLRFASWSVVLPALLVLVCGVANGRALRMVFAPPLIFAEIPR